MSCNFTLSQSVWEFAKSRAIRAMCASVVYVPILPTCETRTNVLINVPASQKCVNYSTWHTNGPKACQVFNLACKQRGNFSSCQKACPIFKHSFYEMLREFLYFIITSKILHYRCAEFLFFETFLFFSSKWKCKRPGFYTLLVKQNKEFV